MNRETLKRVSRMVQDSRQPEHYEGEHNPYPEYDEHRISSRYGGSTNTYRAHGTVEGVIEHNGEHDTQGRQIGFRSENARGRSHDRDFHCELEDAFEKEIDDIVYYSELAMEAEHKGHVEFANGFYEIAKDKLTCAESMRYRLLRGGKYDPSKQSEMEEMFDRAKRLFKRL